MKKMFHFLPVVVFLVMIGVMGCGAGLTKSTGHGMIETIDPFQYGDEFDAVRAGDGARESSAVSIGAQPSLVEETQKKEKPASVHTAVISADTTNVQTSVRHEQTAEGTFYRAQIGVFEDQRSAEKLAMDARGKVSEKVYVEFEPPFYRVRVGDFQTRKEAESFVKVLQDLGFRGSFWVMKRPAVR